MCKLHAIFIFQLLSAFYLITFNKYCVAYIYSMHNNATIIQSYRETKTSKKTLGV